MYMRARMYNPVTLPALTAARRSPPYLRGVRLRKALFPVVDSWSHWCRTPPRADRSSSATMREKIRSIFENFMVKLFRIGPRGKFPWVPQI